MKSRRGCYVLKCKSLWLQDWPKQITSGDLQETISPGGGGGWHQHNLPPQNLLVKKEKRMPWGGCLVTVHCFWLLDVLCLSSLAMPCWMCCVSVHRLCHVGCAVSQFIGHAMLDVLCLSSSAMPCWMCCVSVHRPCRVGCAVSQFIGHAMLDVLCLSSSAMPCWMWSLHLWILIQHHC